MISKDAVIQEVNEYLQDAGYYPVDVIITPDNKITVEIDAFEGVSLDFCAELNRHLEKVLSPEIDNYDLEVCSAGLTQPFKVLNQYRKNLGKEVEVVIKTGAKLKGVLKEVTDEYFVIETEKQTIDKGAEKSKRKVTVKEETKFAYNEIKTTKYILRFR